MITNRDCRTGGLRGSLEALENVLQIDDIAGTRR